MGAVVQPPFQGAAINQGSVMGENEMPCQCVKIREQVHGHKSQLGVHKQRQRHRLDIEVVPQAEGGGDIGECLINLLP